MKKKSTREANCNANYGSKTTHNNDIMCQCEGKINEKKDTRKKIKSA